VAAEGQHNLTPSIDWSDGLIGSGGLLLVLSHHLESQLHLAGGLRERWETISHSFWM
jgi:hypothetical protein